MKAESIISPGSSPGEAEPAHFLLDHWPGRTGPARVVEVLPGRAPLVHDFASGADALAWLTGEHEAALLLDTEIVELVPVVEYEAAWDAEVEAAFRIAAEAALDVAKAAGVGA